MSLPGIYFIYGLPSIDLYNLFNIWLNMDFPAVASIAVEL